MESLICVKIAQVKVGLARAKQKTEDSAVPQSSLRVTLMIAVHVLMLNDGKDTNHARLS